MVATDPGTGARLEKVLIMDWKLGQLPRLNQLTRH